MNDAWSHYVSSHNLLNELRGVTKNYPFSSQCLDEAKSKVSTSPTKRDQNYCWLVLARIRSQ